MNSTNPKKKIQLNMNALSKKKISISIYSNPYNVNAPFVSKPKQTGLSSVYKMTGEKISNLNNRTKKHDHKLTLTNIMNILHTTTSTINKKNNQSLMNKKNGVKISSRQNENPAKNSMRTNSTFHSKNYSISISKRKIKNVLGVKEDFFGDIEKKIKEIRRKNNNSNVFNNKSTRNPNQSALTHHERATSFSYRNVPITKETRPTSTNSKNIIYKSIGKKNTKVNQNSKPSNKIVKIKRKNILPIKTNQIKRFNTNNIIHKPVLTRSKRPDISSSKIKTTDATPHTTLQKENSIIENSLFNISNEFTEEEDEFNDINAIVRKIDFNNNEETLDIFSIDDNKSYDNYSKMFITKFEQRFKN